MKTLSQLVSIVCDEVELDDCPSRILLRARLLSKARFALIKDGVTAPSYELITKLAWAAEDELYVRQTF